MARAVCPLCRSRKPKRPCPAKGESICPACCGAKRRVEIDCPEDCVYLTGGHAGAWEGRGTERRRDARRILLHAQALTETQGRLLFLSLVSLVGLRASRPGVDDALARQAVHALRRTVETRERGVLYDHQAEDVRAQPLVHELRSMFEAKDEEGRSLAPADRDLLAALTALEAGLDASLREEGGATFLDSAARVVGRAQGTPAAPPRRPLIVEP